MLRSLGLTRTAISTSSHDLESEDGAEHGDITVDDDGTPGWASADLAGEAGSVTRGDTMGMVAWLVIGAGIGWLLGRRNSGTSRSETVMAVAIGVVGAILGGLAAVFLVEGQLDLEWQLSGGAGAALGALLPLLWLRPFSR